MCVCVFRQGFTLIAQVGVQWHNIGSLWPPPSRFKQFSCLRLLSIWDYRRPPLRPVNFCIFLWRWGFSTLARLISNSWPQVIRSPRPLSVLGFQAWATSLSWSSCYWIHSLQHHFTHVFTSRGRFSQMTVAELVFRPGCWGSPCSLSAEPQCLHPGASRGVGWYSLRLACGP